MSDNYTDEITANLGGAAGPSPAVASPRRAWWLRFGFLAVWGPGLVVMLADTDAGSVITAAQSGAQWGYRMILPQVILMPILYVVQEITVRLGIVTKQGHGALIRAHFGRGWAWLSASTLFVSVIGALFTEFAGIAGVGELFGIAPSLTVPVATALLVGLALTGSYTRVERVGIAFGLAELAFFAAMLLARPHAASVWHGIRSMPLGSSGYLLLVAANVGAVIMPWMIFYQQGAIIDKRLSAATIRQTRSDTAVGAVLTQLIMIAIVVTVSATVGAHRHAARLNTVGQISRALTPYLGYSGGRILFGLGMLGAALVAAIVSSLAGAWGLAEVSGWKHTLNERPSRQSAKFYLSHALAHVAAAVVVLMSANLIRVSVDVMVMNALLLPIVLGFLLVLEARVLPPEWRMHGPRRYLAWGMCALVIGFGLYMIPLTLA